MLNKLLSTILISLFLYTISFGQLLNNIESVEYDPLNDQWFVSNNTNIVTIDNVGNQSAWDSGSASYGMEVVGDKLFVVNNGRVNVYNTSSKQEVANVPIPGAGFLNGMTSNGSNLIWVTDFGTNKIFELDFSDLNNVTIKDLINTIVTPNGIVYEAASNSLYYVTWGAAGQILNVDLNNDPLLPPSIAASGIGLNEMDGIDQDADGNFYVSSWTPTRITKFNSDFSTSETIDAGLLDNPADICFSVEKNTLAIPNSGNATVNFVNFGATALDNIETDQFGLEIFPNPMSDNGLIIFVADQETEMQIYSGEGRLILQNNYEAGYHHIAVQNLNLANGFYYCVLSDGKILNRKGFVVK